MAKTIKIDEIGRLIDEEPYHVNWFNYNLGGGWGSRLAKYAHYSSVRGTIIPGISNAVSILQVHKKLKDGNFDDISGFYVGILCFLGEKFYKNLNFVKNVPKNSVNTIVATQKCPERFKDEIYEICHSNYDFLSFLEACGRNSKLNFDLKSAISVYKLQGDASIYSILCQIFYINKGIDDLNVQLVERLPVQLPVQVSNYLSGCNFPVVVSPNVTNFVWKNNQNGHFLYAEYGDERLVLDVAGCGSVNLSNYALANRLNYLGGGGKCVPYLICWNWGEVVDAYHHFGGDLLIRDLKNDLFNHYWFVFGPESLLNVRFRGDFINLQKNCLVKPNFNPNLISVDKYGISYILTNLMGDFVDYCEKKDVFYSDSEIFDWFELGRMLK